MEILLSDTTYSLFFAVMKTFWLQGYNLKPICPYSQVQIISLLEKSKTKLKY